MAAAWHSIQQRNAAQHNSGVLLLLAAWLQLSLHGVTVGYHKFFLRDLCLGFANLIAMMP